MSELLHYGTPRHSGRYPWGSGKDPYQSPDSFLSYVKELRKKGLSDSEIAKGLGWKSSNQLRARISMASDAARQEKINQVLKLKKKNMSNVAIAARLGISEATVRNHLKPQAAERASITKAVADVLKEEIGEDGVIQVGKGVEHHLNITDQRLKTAVAYLEDQGYQKTYLQVPQVGTGEMTTIKVLHKDTKPRSDIYKNPEQIKNVMSFSPDKGRTFEPLVEPKPISSKRVAVRYADQGGADADGVIEIRRGVEDLSMGSARYMQVRVAVDGDTFLKGMAVYSDNIPPGKDIVFNTNKHDTGNMKDVFKAVKDDPLNPFGSSYRQNHYIDANGERQLSALNVVNEEGNWKDWSKKVSSQMLSKQRPSLAKEQLDLTYKIEKENFDEVMSLTNPTVKKKLLMSLADGADAASTHLKAAAMPRSSNHVILPVQSLKPTEVYAPKYRNGEEVVLIRHPHGGIFEIPRLRVNNSNREARSLLGASPQDAVGINPKVAQQLSGADFDGDTVLVIPTAHRNIATKSPLMALKNFDPHSEYKAYPGMRVMSNTQQEMGKISNLITDMSVKGANENEIARAVRHSMVVIDAEKHKLDYRRSANENMIPALKEKYQRDGTSTGAATLISRASSTVRVPERRPRYASEGGPIDKDTGQLKYTPTGESYTVTNKSGTEKEVVRLTKSKAMLEVDDAYKLSSGTPIEAVYADHANKLKSLANTARKEAISTPPLKRDPGARRVYATEVEELTQALKRAQMNAPLERQAQLLANAKIKVIRESNPDMDKDDIKRVSGQALAQARMNVGAHKDQVSFTPRQWEAIQAGAISDSMLGELLNNADLDRVKELATPRTQTGLSSSKVALAQSMQNQGYTLAEIAQRLGVSSSTVVNALNPKS